MIIIYPKFNSLKPEKRERIINAAIKEFVQNGYEKASTNEIVKEAKISKGSLFSYFSSKKELYLFLLEYVLEVINKIYDQADWNETDLLKRIREIALIKLKIIERYSQAFNFLKSAVNEYSAEVKPEIDRICKYIIESGFERFDRNIDPTKFRDDIDIEKTISIINWVSLSFVEQQRDKINSFEGIGMESIKEWDEYSDIMKRCFYKKQDD